jgi:hypothetical protein
MVKTSQCTKHKNETKKKENVHNNVRALEIYVVIVIPVLSSGKARCDLGRETSLTLAEVWTEGN